MIQAYNNTPRKCLDYRTPTEIFLDRALHVKWPCQRFKSTPKAVAEAIVDRFMKEAGRTPVGHRETATVRVRESKEDFALMGSLYIR